MEKLPAPWCCEVLWSLELGVMLPDAARTLGPPASRLSLSEPCQAVAAAAGCTVPRRGKCRGCVEKLSGKHAALSVVKGSGLPAFVNATRPHAFQTVLENEAVARQTRPHALEKACSTQPLSKGYV